MNEKLQEMLDHYEITKTLGEYCHGCDRCDETQMASVYMKDSWDDHGRVQAKGSEFARVMTGEILATTKTLSHMLGQSMINVKGDEAGAETYFFAVAHSTNENGVKLCNQLGGRFVDKLQRENGRWRIKHRIVVRDWSVSMPVELDWTTNAGLRDGERSNADPSYTALGFTHSGMHRTAAHQAELADK